MGCLPWGAFTLTSTPNAFFDHLLHLFLTMSSIYPYAAGYGDPYPLAIPSPPVDSPLILGIHGWGLLWGVLLAALQRP